MRSLNKLLLMGSTAGLAVLASGGTATAAPPLASDTNPTLPNVLLLVDTSGQMQLSLDGGKVVTNCDPPPAANDRSRWSLVIEALTGSLPQLTCDSSGAVGSRYGTGGNDVCFPGKNPDAAATSLTNPWDWGTDPSAPLEARSAVCNVDQQGPPKCCKTGPGGWEQNTDGAIDLFGQRIRFALMTSDLGTHADTDNTEHNSAPSFSRERWKIPSSPFYLDSGFPSYSSLTPASRGGYSYWWNGGGIWSSGATSGSASGFYGFGALPTPKEWEVGVRNRNAEPWEGRMMGFGNNGISASDLQQQSDRIQQVLLATHPHYTGALGTPLPGDLAPMAGMLSDASDFIMNDTDALPGYPSPTSTPDFLMGPKLDPAAACRSTDLVVIAGGEIGLDMLDPAKDGYVRKPTNWVFTPLCLTPLTPWLCAGPTPLTSCNDSTFGANGVCPYSGSGAYGSTFLNNIYNYVQLTGGAAHVMAVVEHTGVTYNAPACLPPATGTSPTCKINCEDIAKDTVVGNFSDYSPGAVCATTPDPVTQALHFQYDGTGAAKGVLAACCELAYLSDAMHEQTQFIDNASQMKQALANIAIRAAGKTTSRVEPSFSTAAPTIDKPVALGGTGSNATSAGPGGQIDAASFEINGGLVSVPNGLGATDKIDMWLGRLERRRFTCSNAGSPIPVADDITTSKGDDFADNLVTGAASRKFFTVVAQQPFGGGAPKVQRSIRINQTDYDPTLGLNNPASDNLNALVTTIAANQTAVDFATALAGDIDGALAGKQRQDVLGIGGKDGTKCSSEFGAPYNAAFDCADQALQWFGGVQHGGPGFVAGVASPFRNDRCPPSVCGWVDFNNVNAHPMGAIYHSQPVTVGPPLDFLNDESYRKDFAPPDSVSAPKGQGNRPTVLYTQTIDGLLHAFVVAKNSGSTGTYASIPAPNGTQLNELWSFIPPILLPQIWPNYNSHAILLDGPITVSDSVVRRSGANAHNGTGAWKTILVGSGGGSSAGGFYYALDVTTPTTPKFLWQLSTAGDNQGAANGPVPLFGPSVPGAAIATVSIRNGAVLDQVAVAILAGGSAGFPAPTLDKLGNPIDVPRRGPGGAGIRGRIRDWGNSVAGRSVTIVELGTGRVLKRFEGVVGNSVTPGDLPTNDPSHILNTPGVRDDTPGLDSPMTGTPVAFPNSPGVAANRAYVGDADGTMWRIDLSNPNPTSWTMGIAWDAYGADPSLHPSIAGQPIETTPIVSADLSGIPVVVFSTGAADGFTDYSAGMTNHVLSFRDAPSGTAGLFSPTLTGFDIPFANGERVTGPMALFNGTVYFSTFRPALSPGVCAVGQAYIWGQDFLSGANELDVNNDGVLDGPGFAIGGSGTVIFGAQLARVPSCSAGATTGSDGWMSGAYKSETTAATGSYQLVFNTGIGASSTLTDSIVGTTGGQTGKTNVMHLKMAAPKALVRLHSWASVSE